MKYLAGIIATILLIGCSESSTKLSLAPLFTDHMVLQQNADVSVWGKGQAGKTVSIEGSWGETAQVKVEESGKWSAKIKTPSFGGPYTLTITSGKNSIAIQDVLIGEVWLCSGQSNMEMTLSGWPPRDTINNSAVEIANANYPQIRMFTVEKALSLEPVDSCKGSWEICTPDNAAKFSATAYFFGRHLNTELNIPIGLIHSSWGGTPAEAWTSTAFLNSVPGYENIKATVEEAAKKYDELKAWFGAIPQTKSGNYTIDGPFTGLDLNDLNYAQTDYADSAWNTMQLPNLWETQELGAFDGIVWFRKEFEMPAGIYPEGFSLFLGPVDDMDVVYLNGVRIGGIEEGGFWAAERNYPIPDSLIKPGKNLVAVRVIDTRGGGGIYGKTTIAVRKGNKEIVNLSGNWNYLPIATFFNNSLLCFDEGDHSFANMPKIPVNFDSQTPSLLYNAMIAPLVPYTIKGAIWYQAESNVGRGKQYETLFPTMINNWRAVWEQGDFPFYFVQIAPYNYNVNDPYSAAEVRDAQRRSLSQVKTGMIVTTDISNINNIHPGNKQDVGKRLALIALANDYGKTDLVFSGPLFEKVEFTGNEAKVSFRYAETGLVCKGTKLTDFEIAGADGIFYPAEAKIVDKQVLVKSTKVKEPKQVRFGCRDIAEPNLFNGAGLPASPFISDLK